MAKKLKRLLAAGLAALMCAGSMGLSASAEEIYIPEAPEKVGNNYPLTKTATELKNDITTVTLSVPAEEVSRGVDIVYILGAFLSREEVETNTMINCLYDTIHEIVKSGIPVNFGMVPFSSTEDPVMPLTSFEEVEDMSSFKEAVFTAIQTAGDVYDGINMENAFVTAKEMFASSELAEYPERQHLVMVSSGNTYYFNGGENNENISTVPVRFILANGTNSNGVFGYPEKTWQRARNNENNSYPVPYWIWYEYTNNNADDKYQSLWDCYWYWIDTWATADEAAGDTVVYNLTTRAAGDFWDVLENVVKKHSDQSDYGFPYKRFGYLMNDVSETDLDKYVTIDFRQEGTIDAKSGPNPLKVSDAAHAICNERAMWEAYNYVQEEIVDEGINFYPVYQKLRANGATTNGNNLYNYWTDQYIGHSFMNFLAGGEAVIFDANKTFFDPIKEAILYTVSEDSKVTDAIGYDAKEGNLDFITDPATIKMSVNGEEYTTVLVGSTTNETGRVIEASYDFLNADGERKFSLNYYYGDGKEGEYFDWNFHTDVSMKERVTLTYDLELVEKSEEAGTHKLDTNRFAALYPVDSEQNPGIPQLFPVPKVEYEVVPYDVDIVLALGAGIAQYDADSSKGSNTYDSIVSLVEPLVNQGINVKLGLVAVEHYDDVAMPLTKLTKDNYKTVITNGLNTIQSMPAGPTNLHGNIVAAKEMLDADTSVPAENKFFHVIATGRTYHYDNADGVPTTIVNKIALKGSTYYYWGHYLWQSQRGRHTSLYMLPDRYNNSYKAFFDDIKSWVGVDGDTYAYSFTDAYNTEDPQWFNTFYAANGKDAKALGLASSRFGWIMNPLTNSGHAGIDSSANPAHALNYERAQYEAYNAFQSMIDAGYNCYALCSESTSYQNDSPYIKIAKYTGTSTAQLGHSFMNFLATCYGQTEAPLLFVMTDPNTGASEMAKNFFTPIEVSDLVKGEDEAKTTKVPMMSAGPKGPKITTQPVDAYGALGETVTVSVEAKGEGLKYQWYFSDDNGETWSKSSIKTDTYEVEMTKARAGRELYCKITDANGNGVESDIVTLNRVAAEELAILTEDLPELAIAALGETVTVSIEAQGEGLKYQWYFSDNDGETFSKSSIKTNTYEVEMTKARAGRIVYCQVTDALGNTVKSTEVTLVQGERNLIVEQPVSAYGEKGDSVSVAVKTIEEDGLKYQWYIKDEGSSKFSKSSTKTAEYEVEMNKTRAGRELYCVVTDSYGNTQESDHVFLILGSTPIVDDEIPAEEPETGIEIPDPETGNEIPYDEPIVLEG